MGEPCPEAAGTPSRPARAAPDHLISDGSLEELLTAQQIALALGVQVKTVAAWRRRGHLPAAGTVESPWGRAYTYRLGDLLDSLIRREDRAIEQRRQAWVLARKAIDNRTA